MENLARLGHETEVIAPARFKSVPCPTYPEIRLATFPRRAIARLVARFAHADKPATITINNKAEGSAPLSVFALAEAIGREAGSGSSSGPASPAAASRAGASGR